MFCSLTCKQLWIKVSSNWLNVNVSSVRLQWRCISQQDMHSTHSFQQVCGLIGPSLVVVVVVDSASTFLSIFLFCVLSNTNKKTRQLFCLVSRNNNLAQKAVEPCNPFLYYYRELLLYKFQHGSTNVIHSPSVSQRRSRYSAKSKFSWQTKAKIKQYM